MTTPEAQFPKLDETFPEGISALVSLACAAEDLAELRRAQRQAETRYNERLRHADTLLPPDEASVFAKRLGESCLIAVERYVDQAVYPRYTRQVTNTEGMYFIGDRVLHTPTDSTPARLRINGLVPEGGDSALRYHLLVPVDELDSITIQPLEGIPEEKRFWPFEVPAGDEFESTYGT